MFAFDDSELGCTSLVQHSIDSGEHRPVKQQPYHTPVIYRAKIEQMISDVKKQSLLIVRGLVPLCLCPKRTEALVFCVDYRCLNSLTKKDVYPLSRVEDILDTLSISRP